MVDEKKIAFNPAVEISFIKEEEQKSFYEAMELAQTTPSLSQALRIKKASQEGICTPEYIEEIMEEEKKNPLERVVFESKLLQKYFPQKTTPREMEMQILSLLEQWHRMNA